MGPSKAPTKAERKWMDALREYGCICCRMDGYSYSPAAIHHMISGGRRMGHMFTLPLCDPGHHQNGQSRGIISRHPWKTQFEEKYGTELELLTKLKQELGYV